MSDIDRVFARMGGQSSAASDQRELRSIPRKGRSAGARVVEVVHLSARGVTAEGGKPRRADSKVRAQTWEDGFPARAAAPSAPPPQPVEAEAPAPVAHVMLRPEPAWNDAASASPAPASIEHQPGRLDQPATRSFGPSRRVADAFDPADDGANCLRCGYVIEPARERRGLMTCGECG